MIRGIWIPRVPLPLVNTAVWLEGVSSLRSPILFVLDTGATHTIVHPADARDSLHIPDAELDSRRWPAIGRGAGIGGGARHLVVSARFAFRQEGTDEPYFVDADLRIAEATPENGGLPSLLGWDILQHFKTTLDGKDAVTLEPREP